MWHLRHTLSSGSSEGKISVQLGGNFFYEAIPGAGWGSRSCPPEPQDEAVTHAQAGCSRLWSHASSLFENMCLWAVVTTSMGTSTSGLVFPP